MNNLSKSLLIALCLIQTSHPAEKKKSHLRETAAQYKVAILGAALGFSHGLANGFLDKKYPRSREWIQAYLNGDHEALLKIDVAYRPHITPFMNTAHIYGVFSRKGWEYFFGAVCAYPAGYIVGQLIGPK